MNREELSRTFLKSQSKHFILELATGYGKTKLALDKVAQWLPDDYHLLIVIPRLVLKKGWEAEIKKWEYEWLLPYITFVTYVSFPKLNRLSWGTIIFDEAHHLSERCRERLSYVTAKHMLFLSATLKKEHKQFLEKYKPETIKIAIKNAIEDGVLPEPKIILIPMALDNRIVNQVIEKNVKKNNPSTPKRIGYIEKWKYKNYKGPLHILCTQQQYYDYLSSLIDWYKQKGKGNAIMKNMWLHKAGERLKWLATQKGEVIRALIKQLSNYRLLTFCPSIEESLNLGCPCINSKIGTDNLTKFNDRRIKHIAAVGMLDEGTNLTECKIGIFQMLNSSDRLNIQRQGRLLRHKSPVLIFPYYVNTREEEIINIIKENSNSNLISIISPKDIDNIKHYI